MISSEGSDEFHGPQRTADLAGGGAGVLEERNKLLVGNIDLGAEFVVATGQISFIQDQTRVKPTDLLSVAC